METEMEAFPEAEYKPLDLDQVRTISIRERRSLVQHERFADIAEPGPEFERFFESLPRFLAADKLRNLIDAVCRARLDERPVVLAMGAHVVKCGLSPLVIDLMSRGVLTTVATNGAGAIHDYEISLVGETSEDVAENIQDGSFGTARETAAAFARAAKRGAAEEIGLGRALGLEVLERKNRFGRLSLLAQGIKYRVPVTVHCAVGTDVVNLCPEQSGSDLGESSYTDFKILARIACDLSGGVWINMGSAVVLPEVFLKVFTVARNIGHPLRDVTTANLDMIDHYRPRVNVVGRPAQRGITILGHHEIMFPLLRMGILSMLKKHGLQALK
jgi:hypothetical protein